MKKKNEGKNDRRKGMKEGRKERIKERYEEKRKEEGKRREGKKRKKAKRGERKRMRMGRRLILFKERRGKTEDKCMTPFPLTSALSTMSTIRQYLRGRTPKCWRG